MFPAYSVSCSFDDPYICGYELFLAASGYNWQRWHLQTPSSRTGPPTDHTIGDLNGIYNFHLLTKAFDEGIYNFHLLTKAFDNGIENFHLLTKAFDNGIWNFPFLIKTLDNFNQLNNINIDI